MEAPIPDDIYQHHKGGHYKVLALAKEKATQADVVVYQSMADGQIWTRPLAEFDSSRFVPIWPRSKPAHPYT